MIVLAIDPGNVETGWLLYNADHKKPLQCGKTSNKIFLNMLFSLSFNVFPNHVVIEKVQSFGMPVGETVFDTCIWTGRMIQALLDSNASNFYGTTWSFLYRKEVVTHICHSSRAKDSNVRQALIDRFGPPGSKKKPGPTFGITKDMWSAFALAVTYSDLKESNELPRT